jgi:hypothetical protein
MLAQVLQQLRIRPGSAAVGAAAASLSADRTS